MRRTLPVWLIFLAVLAGCSVVERVRPNPQPSTELGLLSIAPGIYDGQVGGACILLEFDDGRFLRRQSQSRFAIDPTCSGTASAQGDAIVEDDQITLGDAVLIVSAVGPASFSGTWSQGGTTSDVRFTRR